MMRPTRRIVEDPSTSGIPRTALRSSYVAFSPRLPTNYTKRRHHCRIQALQSKRKCNDAILSNVTTPHSGYHFDGSRDRFFEGWYWKVNLCTQAIIQTVMKDL